MTEEPAVSPGTPAEPSAEAPGGDDESQAATGSAEPPPERPSLRATLAQRWKLVAAVLPALGFGLAVARYYQGCEAERQARTDDTWGEVRAASENPEDLSRTANIRERIEALHQEGESFRGLNIENFRLRTPISPGRTSRRRSARTPTLREPVSRRRVSVALRWPAPTSPMPTSMRRRSTVRNSQARGSPTPS